MKAALWRSALLLLLGAAAATPTATASEEAVLRQLQRRQLTGLVGGKPAKPERIVKLEPRVRKDATRVQLRFGPYTLPALHRDGTKTSTTATMDPNGFIVSLTVREGLCTNCTVLAGKADITFDDGARADVSRGVYLHHILILNRSKKLPDFTSFCPATGRGSLPGGRSMRNPLGSTFLGGAVDEFTTWYTPRDGKTASGYYLKNDTIAVQAEVINYRYVDQKVYLTMDVEYLPGKYGRDSMSTLLTVTGCSGSAGWFSKSKKSRTESGAYPMLQDGIIISVRGHLHDGGTAMELYVNGVLRCNSAATYGGKGGVLVEDDKKWESISAIKDCQEPIRVKKGDLLKLVAVYDTESHPLREQHGGGHGEEMGIMSFTFVPDRDATR